jgi:rhodanese-related sulfurtransferase
MTLDSVAIEKLLNEKAGLLLLDVRTPEEYVDGHIQGARNYNYYSPEFSVSMDRLDRDQPCLLYCATGKRSSKAREIMQKLGFQTVYQLDGGLRSWIKAGKPLAK